MEQSFEKGDIVRLLKPDKYFYLVTSHRPIVAKIEEIHDDYYIMEGIYYLSLDLINDSSPSAKIAHIPFTEVEPVEINSGYDRDIYMDGVVCASFVEPGKPVPVHNSDYSYYYDRLDHFKMVDGSTYKDLLREKQFKYVHEFQRYLREQKEKAGLNEWLAVKYR